MTIDAATRDDTEPTEARLGPGVAQRMRLPGPPRRDVPRGAPIGSLASASQRFATSLGRPVPTRHGLRGPQVASVQSFRNADTSPPRWWHPELVPAATDAGPGPGPTALPPRGLPRAVHQVQTEDNRTPGGILGSLVSTVVPVRRMDAVVAAGPMLTSHDKARLTAATTGRPEAAPTASAAPAAAPRRSASAAHAAPLPPATPPPPPPPPPSPAATPPADGPSAAPQSPPQPPSAQPPSASTDLTTASSDEADPGGPGPDGDASAVLPEAHRARWRPERLSRLQATRAPGLQLGVPRGVGVLAGVGAGALGTASMLAEPRQLAPLRRMVGGGHAVSPSAAAADASVTTPGSIVGAAAWRRTPATEDTAPRAGRHRATAEVADAGSAVPNTSAPATAGDVAAASVGDPVGPDTASEPASAPGRRRAAESGPAGIALATARRFPGAAQTSEAVRPALAAAGLPALSGGGVGHAWLPGAHQRASAAAGLMLPGAGIGGGRANPALRARGFGMSDLLSTTNPLARDTDAARNGLASAFGAPDLIRPAGSSAPAMAPAPSVGAVANGADGADTSSSAPLAAARQRAASRVAAATASAAAALGAPAASALTTAAGPAAGGAVGGATALGAAAAMGAVGAAGSAASTAAAQVRQRRASAGLGGSVLGAGGAAPASLLSHLPAPPPMSLRPATDAAPSAFGGSAPPVPGSGAAAGAGGALKRSLIDVTAGMFDSLGTGEPDRPPGPAVPASFAADPEGTDAMAGVQRRLAAVSDSAVAPAALPGPDLDNPAVLNALVDEVVERIEARVIDELERRGRRYNPGVF